MALVNTAHVLAKAGWRVLMVDFDLEAPGMTYFFREKIDEESHTVRKDALDLLLEAKASLGEGKAAVPLSLSDYIVHVTLPKDWCREGDEPYLRGCLDLIPATLEPFGAAREPELSQDYLSRLDMLNLPEIFAEGGPQHRFGNHIRQFFVRARFIARGDISVTLRPTLHVGYDIVLIDARTGFNEVSGLSIGPVCDSLVVCCALNTQNVHGTHYFLERAGLLNREKGKPYTVVAGPVPVWQTPKSRERIDNIRRELKVKDLVEVPYHPGASLTETVFVEDEPEDPISVAYRNLADRIASKELSFSPRDEAAVAEKAASTDDWRKLGRRLAQNLHLARHDHTRSGEVPNSITFFPTAFSVLHAPSRERTERPLSNLAVTAAVAAYRTKSEQPFEMAWEKLTAFDGDSERVLGLGVRLIFFHLRVFGQFPRYRAARPLFMQALQRCMDKKSERRSMLWHMEPDLRTDVYVTALYSLGFPKAPEIQIPASDLRRRLEESVQFSLRGPLSFRYMHAAYLFEEEKIFSGEETFRALQELLVLGVGRHKPRFRSSIQLSKFLSTVGRFTKRSDSGAFQAWDVAHVPQFRGRESDGFSLLPLGMWLEPGIASALAVTKGKDAVAQIVFWLKQARREYGYAWRVLIDWHHLSAVSDDPRFIGYMQQEDEVIDEIERAFDMGHFSL